MEGVTQQGHGPTCSTELPTPAGRYLAYDNSVGSFVARYAEAYARRKGRAMTEMHKHLLGAAYQLATFRDALAVSR